METLRLHWAEDTAQRGEGMNQFQRPVSIEASCIAAPTSKRFRHWLVVCQVCQASGVGLAYHGIIWNHPVNHWTQVGGYAIVGLVLPLGLKAGGKLALQFMDGHGLVLIMLIPLVICYCLRTGNQHFE